MTVPTLNSVAEFATNGVTTNYPFFFKFLANEDLVVTYVNPLGVSAVLTFGLQYTVNGAGDEDGGSVVTTTALAGPGQLIVSREMDAYQQTSLRNQGKFLAETHEDVFDRLTMLIQQGFSIFKRALVRPFGRDYYDAENRRIANLADPTELQDAATRGWSEQFIADILETGQGPVNNAANVLYSYPNGTVKTVQSLSGAVGAGGALGIGYRGRTIGARLDDMVFVTDDYGASGGGAKGDGVTDDYAAIVAARDFAVSSGRKTLVFPQPAAFYAIGQMLELAMVDNFRVIGIGFPTIKYVGTASVTAAVSMDRTIGGGRMGLGLENLNIQGNSHTSNALYMRAISHSAISNVRAWDAVTNAIRISSGVCNTYDMVRATSVGGYGSPTLAPNDGIRLDAATAGDYVAWCSFRNIICENVPGNGLRLEPNGATGNSFIGGTSEGNGRGILVSTGCNYNLFQCIDFEVNTGASVSDMVINGSGNTIINCQSLSPASSVNYSVQVAEGTTFYGGNLRAVNLQSTSKNTRFFSSRFSDHVALGITGSGTYTCYGCVKEDNAGVISSEIPDRTARLSVGNASADNTIALNVTGLGTTSASNAFFMRSGGGVTLLQGRNDGLLMSPAAFASTTANPANGFIASDGTLSRSTSALKYKDVKGPVPQTMIDQVMELSGFLYQQKDGGDGARLFVGMAADDFDVDGLRPLVSYGEYGEVEGLHYERITVILLEELKSVRARVAKLESTATETMDGDQVGGALGVSAGAA